jgi:hypothetical protein
MNSCVKSLRSKNKDQGFNLSCDFIFSFLIKNPIKLMAETIIRKTKRKEKKSQKTCNPQKPKKGES